MPGLGAGHRGSIRSPTFGCEPHFHQARPPDGCPGLIEGPRTSVALTSLAGVPTNAGSQITFSLSSAAQVQARILNIAGRPVRTLCRAKDCDAGTNTLLWNAHSDQGLPVPSGVYLVEIQASGANGSQSRSITQLRLNR